MRTALRLLVILTSFAARLVAAEPPPLPSQADLHQLFDEAKYALVLQGLQRILVLKGAAAEPYDRHDLLRLKGETYLRTKAQVPAAQAFTDAAAAAKDDTASGLDRATALLVKRSSPQQTYTPKPKPRDAAAKAPLADPIPIVEAELRKKALAALFEDERAAAEPKVSAAARATQLAPALDALVLLHELRVLEVAATGGDDGTKKLVVKLGTHASELMADAVKSIGRDVDLVEKNANQSFQVTQYAGEAQVRTSPAAPQSPRGPMTRIEPRWRKRGLTQQDTQTLRTALVTLDKVVTACKELADATGEGAKNFDAVRAAAVDGARTAERVLNEDYTKLYTSPPRQ